MGRITVKPVTRDDVVPLIKMELTGDQNDFVAPNSVSLAQVHYEGGGYPFAIRSDGEIVGFIQIINMRECPNRTKDDDPESIYLWRFMISQKHQGQGIGRRALEWLENYTRDREIDKIYVTCVPENAGAMHLYEKTGYIRTGRISDGEAELLKILSD